MTKSTDDTTTTDEDQPGQHAAPEALNEAGNIPSDTQAIDLDYTEGVPAAKADVTHEHIVENPQADVLAWDPKPIPNGDPTVPRADSHDPRPAIDYR